MNKIIEYNGEKYVVIGNRAIKIERIGDNGKSVIKVRTEEVVHPDGRKDIIIHLPYLQIKTENSD